jgi:hypothetical protein
MGNNVEDKSILWRRLDRPGHEWARLIHRGSTWHLTGTGIFVNDQQPARLDYSAVCDRSWQTSSARVAGWVGNETIEIELSADAEGRWQLNGTDQPAVVGCTDIDFEFSPSTNLLPIRRLNLEVGEEAKVRAAWLRFPGFTLELLEQLYRRIDDDTYRYESGGGKFATQLKVNRAGFVTRYPDLSELESEI